MSETPLINVGDKLGQFKLDELIAIGGMGHVYRGYDTALDRYVAVKILAPELASDPSIAARFLEEARAAAALNHVNVVHIYSAGQQAGAFYFVMELVNGQHLEALLNSQPPLTARVAIDFIRQAALGLQHAHEHGLIHGDVKPANFLVSETGVLKVTDFGLARRVKAPPGSRDGDNAFGTPGYVSPEVINGQPPDHRSDIYSLGATFFHMLAGRPPFAGATPEETIARHLREPAPPIQQFNAAVSAPVGQVIARMLAKEPAGRFQSYTDLLQALQRLSPEPRPKPGPRVGPRLGNEPSVAAPKAPVPAPPPVPKRESWVGVVFTLIALIASVFILSLVYKMRLADPPVAPPATKAVPAPRPVPVPVPVPVANREADAQAVYRPLKTAADAALAESRWGQALAEYAHWPAQEHAGTTAQLAVEAERKNIQSTAAQAWAERQRQIAALHADRKYTEALGVADRFAQQCAGLTALLKEIEATRRMLAEAVRASETARIPASRLEEWRTQLAGFITGFQWDKGQQEMQQALTEAGADPDATQTVTDCQTELASLVAMREAIAQRLRVNPSKPVTISTKRGDLQGQVTGLDAEGMIWRQSFGEAGFAESRLAWTDLTPASACRVLMVNLNANDPDELFGYAVLIAHQALAKQAQPDDARKTLQVVIQRDAARAPLLERYLKQLAELEPPAPRPVEAKPTPTPTPATEAPKPKPVVNQTFQPLAIHTGYNAKFIGQSDLGAPPYIRLPPLENPDRVPIKLNGIEGWFNVRVGEKKDTIALANNPGQGYPQRVAFQLPQGQSRKYAQLAILSGAENVTTPVILHLQFQTGADEEVRFTTYDVHALQPPQDAVVAHEFPATRLMGSPRYLYQQLVEINPQRVLVSLSFRREREKSSAPSNCVGIFAISGLAADPAP